MHISDWSSDVCSSDLNFEQGQVTPKGGKFMLDGLALGLQLCQQNIADAMCVAPLNKAALRAGGMKHPDEMHYFCEVLNFKGKTVEFNVNRSEEHTSELQSLMRISYAVFCLKKTKR